MINIHQLNTSQSANELIEAIAQIPQPLTGSNLIEIYNLVDSKINQFEPLKQVNIICALNDLELEELNEVNREDQKNAIICKLTHLQKTKELLERVKIVGHMKATKNYYPLTGKDINSLVK
jgi:hypothetical protein